MPHDLSEYEVPMAEFIRSTYSNPDDYPLEVWQEDARQLLASPVVAQLLADERERIAHAIDAERYTDRWGDDAVRFGLSIAARIARGQA